jgi:dihydrofolate synthase/folylpolyglutamate synthase
MITVGGTNGKGSTVAFIEAAALAQGWRVGAYTSPHIDRYNERVRIDRVDAADAALISAFERIEAARGQTPLTYFEFGTLAAFLLMAESSPALDLAVLEVGLGGRLDAVNLIDADVAVVTTVALDHQEWLGDTRASIGREKAGIARCGHPLLVGERDAEPSLILAAIERGAIVRRLGIDFDTGIDAGGMRRFRSVDWPDLVLPPKLPLIGTVQWDNAATALAAIQALASANGDDATTIDSALAAAGLANARLCGRLERLSVRPEIIVDVGHNPQAAQVLAAWLHGDGAGRVTDVVFSALADKDIVGIVRPLLSRVRHWHLCGLTAQSPRGLPVEMLAQRLGDLVPDARIRRHETVADALAAASTSIGQDERVLAFGSFHVVAAARKWARAGL